MRKFHRVIAVAFVLLLIFAGVTYKNFRAQEAENKKSIRIGVSLYRGDDSFINTLRTYLEEQAKEYEKTNGVKVVMEIVDAKGDQNAQNSQVDRFISLGYNAICVNAVDRSMTSNIISRAMDAKLPVVFFNREPVEEDMRRWEKLYYVGINAKETAILQGNILVEAYKKDPASLDLNGDGKVSYVLLEGENSHQDSLIRTEWSIQTLKDGGVPLEKITGGIANWDRSQASAWMDQWLSKYPDQIEVVICNNDDMALGASDAIERNNIKTPIKIVGIDGTPQGIEGLHLGKIFGTVQCDSKEYAHIIFEIAAAESLGENVQEKVTLKDGKYYECGQKAVYQQ